MQFSQSIGLTFDYMNKHYEGEAIPALATTTNLLHPVFDIYLEDEYQGTIVQDNNQWMSDNHFDQDLISVIGNKLLSFIKQL